MKILYLCHRLPTRPYCGGRIRPFHTIKYFATLGHEVTVASIARSAVEESTADELRAVCAGVLVERLPPVATAWNLLGQLPRRAPFSMAYFRSRRLWTRVRAALRATRFDLLFVHCSSMAQYVEDVDGIPKVLDFGDMDSQKWLDYARMRRFPLSAGFRLEGARLRAAETELAGTFDYCTCTTRAEIETLRSRGVSLRCGWFANGVDADYFHPQEGPVDRDRICFTGRMDYYPNVQAVTQFCAQTLPLLRAKRPDLRFFIVGANPSRAVRRLARLPGVAVTGAVPDVRPYVQRAVATVAPLAIARGTQNKILESMAMGVPVVASALAAAGVDAVPGEHLLVAEGPEDSCAAILRLADDQALRDHYARAGRARVRSHHDWRTSLDGLSHQLREHVHGLPWKSPGAHPELPGGAARGRG
jgi:sugar transferase (PEP-CTERM/EpsH1 system associated)